MTPENLTKALQIMECDEEELLMMLSMRADKRAEVAAKGFTLDDLINQATIVDESGDGEFFASLPVVIRLPNRSHPDQETSVDCRITACAMELVSEDNSGKTYQLVLDIENPLE